MSKQTIIISKILTFTLFVFFVLISVSSTVFDLDFYSKTQNKYDVAQKMNLSNDELEGATMVALIYTKGYTNDLTYLVERNDKKIDIYSQDDKLHMIDVQNLYRMAYNVMILALVISVILMVILWVKRQEITYFTLTSTINKTSLYIFLFSAFIGVFAFVNFNVFWTLFHEVFFSNDLWLMDPAIDALVNLFPEPLFSALVFKILTRFIIVFGLLNLVVFIYRHRRLRNEDL